MSSLNVILLAAGRGERMLSRHPKVLHPLFGRPLLSYPLQTIQPLHPEKVIVVIGHQGEKIKGALGGSPLSGDKKIRWVDQGKPLGTGHAVLRVTEEVASLPGWVLILYGDVPLLKSETLLAMRKAAEEKGCDFLLMTTHLTDPTGYGRILRNERGEIVGIVEEKEATEVQKGIQEINPGIYLLKGELLSLLTKIRRSTVKKEYYLTDLVGEALRAGKKVSSFILKESLEVLGVNHRGDLARVGEVLRKRINQGWMEKGVSLMDPLSVWIDPEVELVADVTLHPGVILRGKCRIEREVEILPYSVVEESEIKEGARIGPFAHLRPGSVIGRGAHVGNFVETKKAILKEGVKANHLTYLGDTEIGAGTNVGAGTITCNYNGKKKHPTKIGRNVFIGSDTQFVAPVKIGDGALIGAGTTVTKNVPRGALVLSRVEQKNIVKNHRKR